MIHEVLRGAGSRTRTDDLLITSQLLYQLSYTGMMFRCKCYTRISWPTQTNSTNSEIYPKSRSSKVGGVSL